METDVAQLIDYLRSRTDCNLKPSKGVPMHLDVLPDDLREFYSLVGESDLFIDSPFPSRIMSPDQVVPANSVLFSGMPLADIEATRGDISWTWYIIVDYHNSNYVTIDLSPSRLGHCYNSSWTIHPGNSYIVAKTFTELLANLVNSEGRIEFWDAISPSERLSPYQ
jgi:hypothetical protein